MRKRSKERKEAGHHKRWNYWLEEGEVIGKFKYSGIVAVDSVSPTMFMISEQGDCWETLNMANAEDLNRLTSCRWYKFNR